MDVHWDLHQMIADLELHPHAYYLPDRWVPHCTIAQNIQPELVPTAFDVARKSFKPIGAKITEIGLVRFRPVVSLGKYQLASE